MKLYEYNDAVETLAAILAEQDKRLLAKELGKLVIKHISHNKGIIWDIKELELVVTGNNEGKYLITIGGQG